MNKKQQDEVFRNEKTRLVVFPTLSARCPNQFDFQNCLMNTRPTPGCFLHRKGRIRTGAGVNDMPGACQSCDPACPAGQVESCTLCHVAADFVSFAAAVSFAKQTPSLIRSVVSPLKIKTALLPCRDKSAVSFNAFVFLFFSFPSIHNGARRRSRPTRRGRRKRRRSR